jgi:hypothetical protein
MLSTPVILGISMATRRNRRLLVAVTYATLLALTLILVIVPSWGRHIGTIWLCAGNACYLLTWVVFTKLVKQPGPVGPRRVGMTSLDLAPRHYRAEDEPDERDVQVMNAACFTAYRVLAWYSVSIWVATFLSLDLGAPVMVKVLQLFCLPLLAFAFTLPQALVLWREPDVPEEARV